MSARCWVLLGVFVLGCAHGDAPSPSSARPAGGTTSPRMDLHGDPLPRGALARLGTVRLRHNSAIRSLAYSPDGKTIASGCHDGLVHLWDVKTGKKIAQFGERQAVGFHSLDGQVVAFAPDGQTIAATGREGVKLWNIAGGTYRELKDDEASLFIAFSPDGKLLGVKTNRGGLRIWDVAAGRKVRRLEDHQDGIGPPAYALTFSPDSTLVASAGEDSILRLWNVRTGELIRQFKGHKDRIGVVAFLPDGKSLVSASWDETLRHWDVSTGRELRRIVTKQGRVHSLAVSPDGKTVVSGGEDGTARLWELNSGREARRFPAWSYNGLAMVLAPDGKTLATSGEWSVIQFWDVATGKEVTPLKGVPADIGSIRFAPDSDTLISRSWWGNTPRLWETYTGRQKKRSRDLPSSLTCLALSPAGEMLTANEGCTEEGWDTRLHYWNLLTGRYLGRFKGRTEGFANAVLSGDGKYLAMTDSEGVIRLWDRRKACEIRRFGKELGERDRWEVVSLQFTPDSSVLIMQRHARFYMVMGVNPNPPSETYFWDTATGKEIARFQSFKKWCDWLAFSPDGALLATNGHGSDYWFHLWDAASGRQLHKLEANRTKIRTAAFSPDGRTVATGHGDGTIWLWETATGSVRRRLEGHTGPISSLDFSDKGLLLASSSADGTGLIWDLSGRIREGSLRPLALSGKECAELWQELGDAQAEKAYGAMWKLAAAARQTVPLMRKQIPVVTAARFSRLIAELDSDAFSHREEAMRRLRDVGPTLQPALQKVLTAKPSPEVRRRLQSLLGTWEGAEAKAAYQRALRGVEILEWLDTAESREILKALADGPPESVLTREAHSALRRLEQRRMRGLARAGNDSSHAPFEATTASVPSTSLSTTGSTSPSGNALSAPQSASLRK
jgi:WD40 repeat protein